jgi:SpoVK/Ycf46/Vps4 family AAA+-type ATPase
VAAINKLSKLFSALADQDVPRAQQFASEIVADEERKGHHTAAKLLKGSLRPNRSNGEFGHQDGLHKPILSGLLTNALATPQTSVKLDEVALSSAMRSEVRVLTKEWINRNLLASAGVRRRSRLLFYGPPGCGKSLTAKALGSTLDLPTYIVRFDGVIGAYLGQTAINLRELFRFSEQNPCILVFDEVDALGKRRGNPLDIGELDRIVIAFMQELEHSHPLGFVVATSNLPRELDLALWRRFDLILEFPKPTKHALKTFILSKASDYQFTLSSAITAKALRVKSYAEAEKLIEAEVRSRILDQVDPDAERRNKR